MHIAKTVLAMAGITLMLFALGCAGGSVEPTPDTDATIEVAAYGLYGNLGCSFYKTAQVLAI